MTSHMKAKDFVSSVRSLFGNNIKVRIGVMSRIERIYYDDKRDIIKICDHKFMKVNSFYVRVSSTTPFQENHFIDVRGFRFKKKASLQAQIIFTCNDDVVAISNGPATNIEIFNTFKNNLKVI